MSLLRNSTLKQLRRINGEIIKQGGKTDRSSDTEQGYANKLWIDNPISGKRKVDTFNLTEIPDPTEQELKMKNEKVHFYDNDDLWFSCTDNEEDIQKYLDKYDGITFSVDGYRGQYTSLEDFHKNKKPSIVHKRDMEKMTVENMKKVNENGDNDSPIDIMKNMKTIRDWQGYTSKPRKERDILVAGKFIETDKVKGYITQGQGVTIHKSNCHSLLTSSQDRIVEIDFDIPSKLRTRVEILGKNRVGLVRDIAALIARENIVIEDLEAYNSEKNVSFIDLSFSIENPDILTELLPKIGRIEGVQSGRKK